MKGRKSRKKKLAEVLSVRNQIPAVLFFYPSRLLGLLILCKLMKLNFPFIPSFLAKKEKKNIICQRGKKKPQPNYSLCLPLENFAKRGTCRTIQIMFFLFHRAAIQNRQSRAPVTTARLLVVESCFLYFCLLCLCLRQVWSIYTRDKYIGQFSSLLVLNTVKSNSGKMHDSFWRGNTFLVLNAQGFQIYSAEAQKGRYLFFLITTYKMNC